MAPLRISRDANCGHSWSSSGTRPASSRSASDSVSAAPSSTVSSVDGERAQLGEPVHRDDERSADAADVDLDAPVGAARDHRRVRVLGQQRERVGEVVRPGEPAAPRGRRRGGRGGRGPGRQRVVRGRVAQRVRGVADRAVAGAAAEVARTARAGRSRWGRARDVGRCAVGRGRALGPVVLGRHAADEARRAVAALRAAADGHLLLHGVQVAGRAEPSAVTTSWPSSASAGTRQAFSAVHAAARRAVGPGDEHRARAALALRAALLGSGEALVAQPVQRRDVRLADDRAASPLTVIVGSSCSHHLRQPQEGDLAQLRDRFRSFGCLVVFQPAPQLREDLGGGAARGADEEHPSEAPLVLLVACLSVRRPAPRRPVPAGRTPRRGPPPARSPMRGWRARAAASSSSVSVAAAASACLVRAARLSYGRPATTSAAHRGTARQVSNRSVAAAVDGVSVVGDSLQLAHDSKCLVRAEWIGLASATRSSNRCVGDLGDLDQRGGVLLGRRVVQPLPAPVERSGRTTSAVAHRDDEREAEPVAVGRGQRGQLLVLLLGEAVSPSADWSSQRVSPSGRRPRCAAEVRVGVDQLRAAPRRWRRTAPPGTRGAGRGCR